MSIYGNLPSYCFLMACSVLPLYQCVLHGLSANDVMDCSLQNKEHWAEENCT